MRQTNEPNKIWLISYGKELEGLVITDQEIASHYYDIHTALVNAFLNNSYAILILEGYMMAFIKGRLAVARKSDVIGSI